MATSADVNWLEQVELIFGACKRLGELYTVEGPTKGVCADRFDKDEIIRMHLAIYIAKCMPRAEFDKHCDYLGATYRLVWPDPNMVAIHYRADEHLALATALAVLLATQRDFKGVVATRDSQIAHKVCNWTMKVFRWLHETGPLGNYSRLAASAGDDDLIVQSYHGTDNTLKCLKAGAPSAQCRGLSANFVVGYDVTVQQCRDLLPICQLNSAMLFVNLVHSDEE